MSTSRQLKQWSKEGIGLFFWTFAFFYSHLGLIILSLVPALFRMIQMWNELQTTVWMEIVVESARVVLFFVMIPLIAKTGVPSLFHKPFWTALSQRMTVQLQRNWPQVMLAQFIVFLIAMYWLMNTLFELLLGEWTVSMIMNVVNITQYDYDSAYNAILFFLKNMSIIPMSMAYILRMSGVGPFSEK